MKHKFIIVRNWIQMVGYWILGKLDIQLSKEPIPEGTPYCYLPDEDKNNERELGTFYIKPCKYYKHLGGDLNGCGYLGIVTDDSVFDDQCKMCGEKEGFGDDYVSDDYVS